MLSSKFLPQNQEDGAKNFAPSLCGLLYWFLRYYGNYLSFSIYYINDYRKDTILFNFKGNKNSLIPETGVKLFLH